MLYYVEKLIFERITNTMLPGLKISLSIVTALSCRSTHLQIQSFSKIFIACYRKIYVYIQALSTQFLLNMKAEMLK